ncbi:Rne/Rng family ribonuclease, partial [Pseudooceanicola lipolyticus]|uniref:Rne/Rng family ribonuclease n=1 Tax=Pseudooceanicola lipolyticus TaxID=2029104 RepID=UPI00155F35E4
MAKKMLIDATHAEETRVVVVDGNKVEEFDFESENKRQLAGNIYLAKVTRVEPSLQAAFVDYGGNRHGFLAFSEIHPDYYQIPVADRQALMEEERAYAEAMRASEEDEGGKPSKSRSRRSSKSRSKAAEAKSNDAVETKEVEAEISGMETIDLADEEGVPEGTSPMELVAETPLEEPTDDSAAAEDTAGDTEVDDDDAEDSAGAADAAAKDDSIESVADEDDVEDLRPPRKPRPRRYKIQEVIKVRQIMLVQVVKEERGNKGAALTTYLSLAGRYCVLMPNTARGGGISRKITNAADRKKLKEIAGEIDVPQGAGLIIRTAGAKRTKAEIKRDYEYLQRLWEQIRELTLKSIAPTKIYEEGDLIKRSIRDLYNREIDEVFVEGDRGYRIAKDFMKMIMPSHAKNVKQYQDVLPLFARYQVESYLGGMFNPTVQLKSGGYIVIGVTEALVAIDVNSGRATKEGSIEETALKTNLEAAEEVARQLRLRDLAGLIVIDFIDMDERKNNSAVEKRLKDKLKTDRARIQVGRISGFGLLEMSRQRLRPGMIEATTQPCPACHGTGLIRSDDNMSLSILRQIEEEGVRRRSREVLVKCPVGIANYLMNQKREHIAQIEGRYGLSVRIEGDPHLVSPDFSLEKFKTATRSITAIAAPVVSVDTSLMDQIDADSDSDDDIDEVPDEVENNATGEGEGDGKPKRKRRRRRRRSGKSSNQSAENGSENGNNGDQEPAAGTETAEAETAAAEPEGKPAEVAASAEAEVADAVAAQPE